MLTHTNCVDSSTFIMPLFNALGGKKVHFYIYNILIMNFQPFHPLRTWKVHVVIFSFHATHFHTLLRPPDFQYVYALFDFWYTMLLIFTQCLPIQLSLYRFVNDCRWIIALWVYWTCMEIRWHLSYSLPFLETGHVLPWKSTWNSTSLAFDIWSL